MDRPTDSKPRPPHEPDPERPERIARRRAVESDARLVGSEPPLTGEGGEGEVSAEKVASALLVALRELRRLERRLEEMSGRMGSVSSSSATNAPRLDRARVVVGGSLFFGLVVIGFAFFGIRDQLSVFESRWVAVDQRVESLAGLLEDSRAAEIEQRSDLEAASSARWERALEARATEQRVSDGERARLERRLEEFESTLAVVEGKRIALSRRIDTLSGQLAVERERIRRLALPPASAGESVETPDPVPPVVEFDEEMDPDPDPDPDPEPASERSFLSRLNHVLAAHDGEHLYRVLSALSVEDGALLGPVLKVFGGERDFKEEIRSERLTVVVNRLARRAAITLHGAERRRVHEDGRVDIDIFPEFQIDFFESDPDLWHSIEEVVDWTP